MKKFIAILATLVTLVGVFMLPGTASADSVSSEYSSCQITWNPGGPYQTGFYYYDWETGIDLATYTIGSEPTGGSSSACEDINFTPHGPNLWHARTFARVYVCPVGGCYFSSWVLLGAYGGVIMPGVPDSMWYYIEYASQGQGSSNPHENMQAWD